MQTDAGPRRGDLQPEAELPELRAVRSAPNNPKTSSREQTIPFADTISNRTPFYFDQDWVRYADSEQRQSLKNVDEDDTPQQIPMNEDFLLSEESYEENEKLSETGGILDNANDKGFLSYIQRMRRDALSDFSASGDDSPSSISSVSNADIFSSSSNDPPATPPGSSIMPPVASDSNQKESAPESTPTSNPPYSTSESNLKSSTPPSKQTGSYHSPGASLGQSKESSSECGESDFGRYGVIAFSLALACAVLLLYALLLVIFVPRCCGRRGKLTMNSKSSAGGDVVPLSEVRHSKLAPMSSATGLHGEFITSIDLDATEEAGKQTPNHETKEKEDEKEKEGEQTKEIGEKPNET